MFLSMWFALMWVFMFETFSPFPQTLHAYAGLPWIILFLDFSHQRLDLFIQFMTNAWYYFKAQRDKKAITSLWANKFGTFFRGKEGGGGVKMPQKTQVIPKTTIASRSVATWLIIRSILDKESSTTTPKIEIGPRDGQKWQQWPFSVKGHGKNGFERFADGEHDQIEH